MNQAGYLAIAIALIAVLAIIFIVTFVLYRKTPLPKGCEDLVPSEARCASCTEGMCPFQKQFHKEEE